MLSAIKLGSRDQLIRTFLDEGKHAIEILHGLHCDASHASSGDIEIAHIKTLLNAAGFDEVDAGRLAEADAEYHLTEREADVLRLVAHGLSNPELAIRMAVSENTVKYHLRNIYSKCAVGNRIQAVSLAKRIGLLG
jgi:LuxR family maltose regulon positive regulatory protein